METINLKKFFTDNHASRAWATNETVSGIGSEIQHTRTLHANLLAFINANNVGSMLDLPCGDLNWMQHVIVAQRTSHNPAFKYIGADIAPNLIEENKAKFPQHNFQVLNVATSRLPKADLIFVRDCLVHLPFEFVWAALANLARTEAKFVAITTFPAHADNAELSGAELGGWRTLNLQDAPFNLPTPLAYITEDCEEYGGVFRDKSLGVWSTAQINEAISASKSNL